MRFFRLLLLNLWLTVCGTGYLPSARNTGAVTIVDATGSQWGVETDETGINISKIDVVYKPEFKTFLQDKSNLKIGFAVGDVEAEITVEGEVTDSTGLMAATFVTAVTLSNDSADFGPDAGGIYLDEVTISQERNGWRKATFKFSLNAGVA